MAETRSRKVHLLFPPSLYDDVQALARFAGTSVNDIVNCVMQKEVNERMEAIKGMKIFDNYTRFGLDVKRKYKGE